MICRTGGGNRCRPCRHGTPSAGIGRRCDALLGRFAPGGCGGAVAGDAALDSGDRLAVAILGDRALRNLALAGQLGDRLVDRFKRDLGRRRDFAVEQLTVFFEVLEDEGGGHAVQPMM